MLEWILILFYPEVELISLQPVCCIKLISVAGSATNPGH